METTQQMMDQNKIEFLANEIARTYMQARNDWSENEFIPKYMDIYQKSLQYIKNQEMSKMQGQTNNGRGIIR